ncbi:MAG: hypothetical protein C0501_26050 [Isosphaera sp.]|nr:hypothetical protein [Isosphaera sp.]
MKFLTVLKDSYREAVDGKVFQAMVVLAGLFILFVASISYRPLTLEDGLARKFGVLNYLLKAGGQAGAPQLAVENYRVTNGAAVPWEGDYELDVVVTCPDPKVLDELRKGNSPLPASAPAVEALLADDYYFLTNRTVTEVKGGPPTEARIRVTTRGTTVAEGTAWLHEPTILFSVPAPIFIDTLRTSVYKVEKYLVNEVGSRVLLLVGIVVTAGFVPNLLRKGTLDLYVVKPIGRSELLVYKYVGGLLFVFLLTTLTVGGVWVVIGLRAGVWAPAFLLLIPILTLYFAIVYAVSVLIGVLTRSALVAILLALLAWGLLFLAGYLNEKIRTVRQAEAKVRQALAGDRPPADAGPPPSAFGLPPWVETGLHGLTTVLPRGFDLDTQASRAIARGVLTAQEVEKERLNDPLPSWAETVGVSVAWIALLLGLACWRFRTRDG